MEQFEQSDKLEVPDFGLDTEAHEATLALPNGSIRKLQNASYEELSDELTIVTGVDADTTEHVMFEVFEHTDNRLEVIKVTVDAETVYEVTKH